MHEEIVGNDQDEEDFSEDKVCQHEDNMAVSTSLYRRTDIPYEHAVSHFVPQSRAVSLKSLYYQLQK